MVIISGISLVVCLQGWVGYLVVCLASESVWPLVLEIPTELVSAFV